MSSLQEFLKQYSYKVVEDGNLTITGPDGLNKLTKYITYYLVSKAGLATQANILYSDIDKYISPDPVTITGSLNSSFSSMNVSQTGIISTCLKKFDTSQYPFNFSNFNFKISDIDKRRKMFSEGKDPYPHLSTQLMTEIFNFYDKYCFGGLLSRQMEYYGITPKFVISSGIRTAGSSSGDGTISMSSTIFERITPKTISGMTISGLTVNNRLDAIMKCFEHELIHLGFMTAKQDVSLMAENHGSRFKMIAYDLFGHTKITHDLTINSIVERSGSSMIGPGENSIKKFELSDIKSGMTIEAKFKDGKIKQFLVVKVMIKRVRASDLLDHKIWDFPPSIITRIIKVA